MCFCLGVVVGICTPLFDKGMGKDAFEVVDTDTTAVYDTTRYTRLELKGKTYRLNVPEVGAKRYVYVPADSATVVYKDSIRYVMLPREYRFTKTEDAEIWHSGIDSTIDSLNVTRKTVYVTTTRTEKYRNRISLGIEAGYSTIPYVPIYLEYGRMLHRNVEIFVKVYYDVPRMNPGGGIGIRTKFEWGN